MAKSSKGIGETIVSFEDEQFKEYDLKLMWRMNIAGGFFATLLTLLLLWLVLQLVVEDFEGTVGLFYVLLIILSLIIIGPTIATIPRTRSIQLYANGIQLLHGPMRIQGARYDRFINFGKIKALEKTRQGNLCFKTAFSSSFLEPCAFLLPSSEYDELIISTYKNYRK